MTMAAAIEDCTADASNWSKPMMFNTYTMSANSKQSIFHLAERWIASLRSQ
jgi:hypothetical protein